MRWLIHSNSPYTFTGYAQQLRYFIPRLQQAGHQVAVCANFGLSGATLNWNNVSIYPLREQRQNADVVGAYVRHFGADVVLSLYDVWALPGDMRQRYSVPWIAMTPVDGAPLSQATGERLQTAEYIVAYSQFGKRQIEAAGFECDYIPHGIDTQHTYTQGDKRQAREQLGIPQDRYLVTVVAANKGYPARKAWPELMAGFAQFYRQHNDALLYCHTTKRPYGSAGEGIYFDPLRDILGIPRSALAFPDQGMMAVGVPDTEIAMIYQASDVFLLPSMGEGFGIPVIESQACGCPVITQAASSTEELTVNGVLIEPLQPMWLPQLGYFWQLPSIERIAGALETVYAWTDEERAENTTKGRAFIVEQYDYDVVWERYWIPFLNTVEETLW